MSKEVRIDKWLWAARIFKTRTQAAEACKKGRISVNGQSMKASRTVHEGMVVDVRKPPILWSFKVLQCIDKRVGAKLAPDVVENVTSPEQLQILEQSQYVQYSLRDRGAGRPTKKDRREILDFQSDILSDDGFEYGLYADTTETES